MILPPAYCITCRPLPDRDKEAPARFAEREAKTRAHFAARGVPAKFFYGIHGKSAGIETTLISGRDYHMPPGHVALVLNHWFLWLHLSLLDPVPAEALVFEDDVHLPPNFLEQYAITRAALPEDWQFWYVGTVGAENARRTTVNARLCKIDSCPFGTHAYLVRSSALPLLLETNQEVRHHIDQQLHYNSLSRLNWYMSWPNLARQRSFEGEWSGSCHR